MGVQELRARHWQRQILRAAVIATLLPGCRTLLEPMPRDDRSILPVSGVLQEVPAPPRLELPSTLPGGTATLTPIPTDSQNTREDRLRAIDTSFPPLPALGPDPVPRATSKDEGLALEALIEQAKANNPRIQQAMAEIDRNRGLWTQAGLYPNPTIGAQLDQIGDFGPYGQFGGYINQNIVTGRKLSLAQGVAYYDLLNARLALRRQEFELAKQVRADYYGVLVAAESIRIGRLVYGLTEAIYRQQVSKLRAGQAANYDASAARSTAAQSRTALFQANNRYMAAWKQLAATLNAPDLPPAPLAGRVDAALPQYSFETLQERMLATHTDLATANNELAQAQQALVLEQRRVIPDVQNYVYMQKDTLAASEPAPSFQVGFQIGVAVPIFNRNQGAIAAAQATLASRTREVERVRNDLVRNLADAFERYETGREQLALYRDVILPDLVRAFRGNYEHYQVEPDVRNFNDVLTVQQNYTTQLANYLLALQMQWQAIADLTAAVQVEDPYKLAEGLEPTLPEGWPLK